MFVQAKHYHRGRQRNGKPVTVRLLVLHAMQSGETLRTAEDVAHHFATTSREASAHECIDADSWVGCVHDEDTAWAAPGANADGWHGELAGMSEQTAAQWTDPYSRAVLALAAKRFALRCVKYAIPVRWLTTAQLQDGKSKGLTTHADVTKAKLGDGTHWDPGPNFPRRAFLLAVQAEVDALRGSPWTKRRLAAAAAAAGVAVVVLAGVTAIPDPAPKPAPKPTATASATLKPTPKSTPTPTPTPRATKPAPAKPAPMTRVLRYGSHGTDVHALQRRLGLARPTDYYGRATTRAVTDFQRKYHLSIDGIAGPQVYARLGLPYRPATRPAAR